MDHATARCVATCEEFSVEDTYPAPPRTHHAAAAALGGAIATPGATAAPAASQPEEATRTQAAADGAAAAAGVVAAKLSNSLKQNDAIKGAMAARTLMFFKGCPNALGCTVLLKGSSREALVAVKKIMQV